MLIKYYAPSKKTFNNDNITTDSTILLSWNNLKYPTQHLSVFDNIDFKEIIRLMDEQLAYIKKEADLFLKYNQLSKKAYDLTIEQYENFFYFNGYFYKKSDLKSYLSQQTSAFNTYIKQSQSSEQQPLEQTQQLAYISRTAIRNITGYSPYFTPIKWQGPTTYVKRQDDLIEDENDLILVLGSRQIGKSYSLSEKAIEESHIPNNDILVGAFTSSSTTTIRNYIRKLTKNFPEGYWEEHKKENYIQNMETGSKIYFRTLADDAVDSVRGMTLTTILVDEAQLVSTYAFEEVLEPTLATTGGKMILIGTPPKVPTGFFVDNIFKYKRGELKNTSYYEIKLTDQPFTHPKEREKRMSQINEPRIQRERFCNLTTDVDVLFKLRKAESIPPINNEAYYVMGIDPARKGDRSAYTLTQVSNGKVRIIESGFVPDTFKSDWKLQAIYFKKIKDKYDKYNEVITIIDSSGVGDGVTNIFQQSGFRINYTVRYTAGNTKTLKNTDYTVSKSILINNLLDFISEDQIEVIDIMNKSLLEELNYIYETESRSGLIGFTSKFFDDITNSLMINTFIIREKKLLSKTPQTIIFKPSSGVEFIDRMEGLGEPQTISSIW